MTTETRKYLQITTDQKATVLECTSLTSYDAINKGVGGYIECVSLAENLDMYVNEEGKLMALPMNLIGQSFWTDRYGMTDIIVGDVVFTGGVDDEGESQSLTDEQIKSILDGALVTEYETVTV